MNITLVVLLSPLNPPHLCIWLSRKSMSLSTKSEMFISNYMIYTYSVLTTYLPTKTVVTLYTPYEPWMLRLFTYSPTFTNYTQTILQWYLTSSTWLVNKSCVLLSMSTLSTLLHPSTTLKGMIHTKILWQLLYHTNSNITQQRTKSNSSMLI